jgi:Ni/Co efflux regulator RcnB
MRKILLSVLAATTALTFASPALAQRGSSDRVDVREERSERAQARQDRSQPQRAQRAQRTERADSAPRANRAQPVTQAQPAQRQAQRQVQHGQGQLQPVQRINQAQPAQRQRPLAAQTNRVRDRGVQVDRRSPQVNQRGRPTIDRERQISRDRADRQAERPRRVVPPQGARPDRMAPPRQTAQHTRAPNWNRDWRRDRRHDWRGYRDRNRTHFRIGVYFDPFGWNYHRFNIGWRLWPAHYSSHFWINSPQMYQLPYAPFPYRWVRYYNDVLLVDTMSGQVVDVIYDFFW